MCLGTLVCLAHVYHVHFRHVTWVRAQYWCQIEYIIYTENIVADGLYGCSPSNYFCILGLSDGQVILRSHCRRWQKIKQVVEEAIIFNILVDLADLYNDEEFCLYVQVQTNCFFLLT